VKQIDFILKNAEDAVKAILRPSLRKAIFADLEAVKRGMELEADDYTAQIIDKRAELAKARTSAQRAAIFKEIAMLRGQRADTIADAESLDKERGDLEADVPKDTSEEK
jgi:hypothetical protein